MNQLFNERDADVTLRCGEFSTALSFYTDELDFRLDGIFPADSPREALLTGHGLTVRLQSTTRPAQPQPSDKVAGAIIVSKLSDGAAWGIGRAGMHYRDLIPGRQGGVLIASHIRIPDGGPVPDYVHYHNVRFQVIYCCRGWVRVVYEDQGPPFVMRAGDCVLQAPGIRHRVLECSDAFEVVEIGSPAEHETLVDHELELPTACNRPDRLFGGQRFVFHQAANASWHEWRATGFEYRETGIAAASGGIGSVQVVRPASTIDSAPLRARGETQFMFVLGGSMSLRCGERRDELAANDSCVIPDGTDYELLDCAAGLEILQVTMTTESDRSI